MLTYQMFFQVIYEKEKLQSDIALPILAIDKAKKIASLSNSEEIRLLIILTCILVTDSISRTSNKGSTFCLLTAMPHNSMYG